ncbi:unnamed protein product [marine sediment metagenome]|uniref:Uncharacterized protein n=1 Tax=marine sediment metagenome TaxID=412755 RepID=X1RPT6_9ZZZZ
MATTNLEDKSLGVVLTNKTGKQAHRFIIEGNCSLSVFFLLAPDWLRHFFATARAEFSSARHPGFTVRTEEPGSGFKVLNGDGATGDIYILNPDGQGFTDTTRRPEQDPYQQLVPEASSRSLELLYIFYFKIYLWH